MNKVGFILLSITENIGNTPIYEWDEFIIFNKSYYLNQLTYDIFEKLTHGRTYYLTKWDMANALELKDTLTIQRLFDVIHQDGSKYISYEDFHEFCALGTKTQILDLLKAIRNL